MEPIKPRLIADGTDVAKLIDLDISHDEVADILTAAGFTGYRFNGALDWIKIALDRIKAEI